MNNHIRGIAHYITFFSWLNKRNIFYERSTSIKTTLTRNNWENRMLSQSDGVLFCYIIHINIKRTDFEHPIFSFISSQSCFLEMDKKFLFCWDTTKMLYSQNWWTIPLSKSYNLLSSIKGLDWACLISMEIFNFSLFFLRP